MKTAVKIALGLSAVGLTAYGIAYLVRQAQLLKQTTTNYKGMTLHSMSEDDVSLTANIEVVNASDITYTVTGANVNVLLNGVNSGTVVFNDSVTIPANGSAVLGLDVDADPAEALKGIQSVSILNLGDMTIELQGTLSVKSAGLMFNSIPFDVTFQLKDVLTS